MALVQAVAMTRNAMISEYQVPAYLLNELPDIAAEFKKIYPSASIVKAIECLARYTDLLIKQQDLKNIRKCFIVANNMYASGTEVVRNAMEAIYIRSLLLSTATCNQEEKEQIRFLMPLHLLTVYNQQLLN